MNWLENTKRMTVDVTSYCNSHCGSCQRHLSPNDDSLHPALSLNHMDVDLWKSIVDQNQELGIHQMYLNGVWGDACMHPKLLDMMHYLVDNSKITIDISTNGSMRTTKFWKELGKISKDRIHVTFCVDGLEDTHSVYRRKTSYNKIIESIKAFKSTGGQFTIITTLFNHNLHQIDELRNVAKNLGACIFKTRKSHSNRIYKVDDTTVAYDRVKNEHVEYTEWIEYHSNETPSGNDSVCPWYNSKDIQVDCWGQIYTCCFASETRFGVDRNNKEHPDNLVDIELNLNTNTLEQALSSDFFKQAKRKIENGDWFICADNCGIQSDKWKEWI